MPGRCLEGRGGAAHAHGGAGARPIRIRVNAVCPGVIRTAMIDRITENVPAVEAQFIALEPVGRMGRAEEVAAAVLYLCSDEASFVTGIAMPVDGGFVAQ